MAQRPSHRLNLYLVPTDPDRVLDRAGVARALDGLRRDGVLSGNRAGPMSEALVAGGFALLRLDAPPLPTLYGNRQGGYYVRCPGCGGSMVGQAMAALRAWRGGGGRGARCPACGRDFAMEALRYAPTAAPGRFAIELRDVGAAAVEEASRPLLEAALGGGFVVVGSRG